MTEWQHVPSCPCFRCEDYRRDNGMSCMYGMGPRPVLPPPHNWRAQAVTRVFDQVLEQHGEALDGLADE